MKINHCLDKPCQNGGRCLDLMQSYACECVVGYEGASCQTKTNMCNYKKCHNGGVCVSKLNDIECLCAPGFSGKQCDTGTVNNHLQWLIYIWCWILYSIIILLVSVVLIAKNISTTKLEQYNHGGKNDGVTFVGPYRGISYIF